MNHETYRSLKPEQKELMRLLHEQWRPDDPVSYGVREAAKKIPCAIGTAQRAFDELRNEALLILPKNHFLTVNPGVEHANGD